MEQAIVVVAAQILGQILGGLGLFFLGVGAIFAASVYKMKNTSIGPKKGSVRAEVEYRSRPQNHV